MAKKNNKKTNAKNKASKPLIIAAIGAGAAAVAVFFGKAFSDMKKSARAQREVDKAEFEAVKAESRASFEENRGKNTFKRAKANAKKSWDDAHMSPSKRACQEQEAREARIAEANARVEEANKRIAEAKKA